MRFVYTTLTHAGRWRLFLFPLHIENYWTDLDETSHENYATGRLSLLLYFKFLQSVITKRRTHEPVT